MEKFFHLAAAKTSVRQELIAGLTTFLAMIYIVPVNANIMSIAGMPFDALVTATALITIIATLFNGLFRLRTFAFGLSNLSRLICVAP